MVCLAHPKDFKKIENSGDVRHCLQFHSTQSMCAELWNSALVWEGAPRGKGCSTKGLFLSPEKLGMDKPTHEFVSVVRV